MSKKRCGVYYSATYYGLLFYMFTAYIIIGLITTLMAGDFSTVSIDSVKQPSELNPIEMVRALTAVNI
jgi:hypothetical protein